MRTAGSLSQMTESSRVVLDYRYIMKQVLAFWWSTLQPEHPTSSSSSIQIAIFNHNSHHYFSSVYLSSVHSIRTEQLEYIDESSSLYFNLLSFTFWSQMNIYLLLIRDSTRKRAVKWMMNYIPILYFDVFNF